MIQSESLATALISPRNPVALLVEKQRKAHTDAVTGKVDIDAAEKDMKLIPKPRRDEVLDILKKPVMPEDKLIQKGIDMLDPIPAEQRADKIASFPGDEGQKAQLYKHYGLTPPAAPLAAPAYPGASPQPQANPTPLPSLPSIKLNVPPGVNSGMPIPPSALGQ
jgi:hypothetical protein